MCRAIVSTALDSELNRNVTLSLAINWYIFSGMFAEQYCKNMQCIYLILLFFEINRTIVEMKQNKDWIWERIKIYFQASLTVEYGQEIPYILKHFTFENLNITRVDVDSLTQRFTTFFYNLLWGTARTTFALRSIIFMCNKSKILSVN